MTSGRLPGRLEPGESLASLGSQAGSNPDSRAPLCAPVQAQTRTVARLSALPCRLKLGQSRAFLRSRAGSNSDSRAPFCAPGQA